jgi:hypothetical protein
MQMIGPNCELPFGLSCAKSGEKKAKASNRKRVWYDFGQCDSKKKTINQLGLFCLTSVAELTGKNIQQSTVSSACITTGAEQNGGTEARHTRNRKE